MKCIFFILTANTEDESATPIIEEVSVVGDLIVLEKGLGGLHGKVDHRSILGQLQTKYGPIRWIVRVGEMIEDWFTVAHWSYILMGEGVSGIRVL